MAESGEIARPSKDPSRFHQIKNLTLTNANTEYSWTLPVGVRKLGFVCRKPVVDVQWTLIVGETNTKYLTLIGGFEKWLEDIYLKNDTLYFRTTSSDSPVMEIEAWY